MLDIKTAYTARLSLEGRLDSTNAAQLEEAFRDALERAEAISLDMSGLEYISSAGLRVLLKAEKAMKEKGGSLTVSSPSEDVMEDLLEIV